MTAFNEDINAQVEKSADHIGYGYGLDNELLLKASCETGTNSSCVTSFGECKRTPISTSRLVTVSSLC